MSFRVKKNDNVVVLTGRDKKKTGRVLYVDPNGEYVKVENINMVSRHKKAKSAQEQGGIVKMEGNIHISDVQILCPECGLATRIAVAERDGKRIRVCKKCSASLEVKTEKPKKGKKDKADKEVKASKPSDSRVKRTRKPKADEPKTEEN